jgi:hypothetical protein
MKIINDEEDEFYFNFFKFFFKKKKIIIKSQLELKVIKKKYKYYTFSLPHHQK